MIKSLLLQINVAADSTSTAVQEIVPQEKRFLFGN